jgi:hypothetical protein
MLKAQSLFWPAIVLFSPFARGEDSAVFTPEPVEIELRECDGWREWGYRSNDRGGFPGLTVPRERISAMAVGMDNDLWVGTDRGRLLALANGKWTIHARLEEVQVTGIAFDAAKIWLSTSDGIRRLDREQAAWKMTTFRHYYQGHPAFVSGGYMPGEDAVRLWGYVDGIYLPSKNRAYAPFVISTEHGLFSWGGYHGVWHHFLPHYWGANSPWLDTRELIPSRRPTCMVEDADANLWVGTEAEGFVRLNGPGREYHARSPENNAKDGTEFTYVGTGDVGCEFKKVVSLAAGREHGVWALLSVDDERSLLARFDGNGWSTMHLPANVSRANCVAEAQPGTILVGVSQRSYKGGLIEVNWASKSVRTVPGIEREIHEIGILPDGRIYAAWPYALYEKMPR